MLYPSRNLWEAYHNQNEGTGGRCPIEPPAGCVEDGGRTWYGGSMGEHADQMEAMQK